MSFPIIRYPLDPTGESQDNLVVGESHAMVRRNVRTIAPIYGAFYTATLVVRDGVTQLPLTSDQYYAAQLLELPSARYGKEICQLIVISDPTVSDTVVISYQTLGGEYAVSAQAIVDMANALASDDRPVTWPALINKPQAFVPSHHLHDVGDLYGFEYVVSQLDRIRQAILLGDAEAHAEMYRYIDRGDAVFAQTVADLKAAFESHQADRENPHQVTAAQLNVFTKVEVTALINGVTNAWTTALAADKADLTAHRNNSANPHGTTAAQVGAYSKTEMDFQTTALENAINSATSATNAAIAAHGARTDNPHATTAAQVGAYSKTESDQIRDAINSAMTNGFINLDGTISAHVNHGDAHPQYLKTSAATSGFVKQGGGWGQGTNMVYMGWSNGGNGVKVQVDASDMGWIPMSQTPNGTFTYPGHIMASGNVGHTSDIRTKTDLLPIAGALEKLRAIVGFTYTSLLPANESAGRMVGVSAQAVQAVLPEGVTVDADGLLAVNYGQLFALTTEAIKEHLDDYETFVREIRSEVAALRSSLQTRIG